MIFDRKSSESPVFGGQFDHHELSLTAALAGGQIDHRNYTARSLAGGQFDHHDIQFQKRYTETGGHFELICKQRQGARRLCRTDPLTACWGQVPQSPITPKSNTFTCSRRRVSYPSASS